MKLESIKSQIYKATLLIILFAIFSNCTSDPYTSDKLNGKSESALIEKLGVPKGNIEFILDKNLREYERGLLKFYPEPDGKNIKIKQMAWERKNRKIIVWLHKIDSQWVSFDNLNWNPKKVTF